MGIVLKVSDFDIYENKFVDGDKSYKVSDIIKIAKDLEIFDLPICGIDLSRMPWSVNTMKNLIFHLKRINNVDMSFPIILDDEGFICDGWHRVARAVLDGQETIKAKRLIVMPKQEDKG